MKKILVTGSRYWHTDEHITTIFNQLRLAIIELGCKPFDVLVVNGAAPGADTIAEAICQTYGIPTRQYPADWKNFKRRAGPIRNREMYDKESPFDVVLAFHDDINASKGTKDVVSIIRKRSPTTTIRIVGCKG